jgi:hypothetical protein
MSQAGKRKQKNRKKKKEASIPPLLSLRRLPEPIT